MCLTLNFPFFPRNYSAWKELFIKKVSAFSMNKISIKTEGKSFNCFNLLQFSEHFYRRALKIMLKSCSLSSTWNEKHWFFFRRRDKVIVEKLQFSIWNFKILHTFSLQHAVVWTEFPVKTVKFKLFVIKFSLPRLHSARFHSATRRYWFSYEFFKLSYIHFNPK